MRQRNQRRESVANIEKLYYPSLPLPNIQTLRIIYANLDSYSSGDKAEYVFLDDLIKTGV